MRLELSRHDNLLNSDQVVEQGGEDIIELSFNFWLECGSILLFNLLRREIDLDAHFPINLKVHGDEVMQGQALSQRLIKVEQVRDVHTVGLG